MGYKPAWSDLRKSGRVASAEALNPFLWKNDCDFPRRARF